MNRISTPELKDTQNEPDHRRIAIDRVGVKNLRFPIQVRDKAHRAEADERARIQNTVATVELTVDLPHHYKGTHMSRFVEVLNEHGAVLHVDNIKSITEKLLARLHSESAHVRFEFPFFLEKAAPVTGAVGLMDYGVRFDATMSQSGFEFLLTVMVPVTTLCPCSKAISLAGAHNQRGQVTLCVKSRHPIWIEELIQMVESCASSELYSLLKRPDEKAVTERAYANPVFVEDLVRAIASHANQDPNILWYRVEAENFESIHNHNAYALVERHQDPVAKTPKAAGE